jgi:23S rRNA G2445 N2-methylase RlmL
VATWSGIGNTRDALTALVALSAELDLYRAAAICASLRPVREQPRFSVTANFVGSRNYNTEEIKEAFAAGVATTHFGWTYTSDDRTADINLRVFFEHEVAYVGVRLADQPLQNRAYKGQHVPGSLKPPVAAALVAMGGVVDGARLLDPCCGAGTILVEGALAGALACGGDVDPAAVAAARANAQAAGQTLRLARWDAQTLPLASGSVDRVVCNLPWGRKVEVDASLPALYRRILAELRRVVAPGGRLVLLTNAPELVDPLGLRRERELEISLLGQTPKILVFADS